MRREQVSLHIFGTLFRQSLLYYVKVDVESGHLRNWAEIWEEKVLKTIIYRNQNNETAGLFSFNSSALHLSQSLNIHFLFQIILQSTKLYRIMALLYSNLRAIQCTSAALGITRTGNNPPKLTSCPFSIPSPRKSSLSKVPRTRGLQHCKFNLHPWGFTPVTPTAHFSHLFRCSLHFLFLLFAISLCKF